VGAWNAALAGRIPSFLTTSPAFRADALWLAALATALSSLAERPRWLLARMLVGAAFAASIKTALLLSTLLAGAALALDPRRSRRQRKVPFAPSLGLAAAGALTVLAPIASFLVYLGIADDFVQCVVLHNVGALLRRVTGGCTHSWQWPRSPCCRCSRDARSTARGGRSRARACFSPPGPMRCC
jgi:hypothetical protein